MDKIVMKKILFIYTDWNASEARKKAGGYGGVSYYRVMKPAEALQGIGWDVKVMGPEITKIYGELPEKIWPAIFSEFDAVVVKQMDNAHAAAPFFYFAQKFNTPVIMDLDDDYFAVKPDQAAWDVYHPGSQKRAIFAASVSLCDALFVSTEPLRQAYDEVLRDVYGIEMPIFVLPNCNRVEDWPEFKERPKPENVTIGYAGSITHNSDLQMVLPALMQILEKYPVTRMEILGALYRPVLNELAKGYPKSLIQRIKLKAGTHSWQGYPELLASQPWDIGICPLVDDRFTRGKSHIKWMEYTMAGLPVVASPTYPYSQPIQGVPVIEDGVTGFLARSTDEWIMILSKLIEDWPSRKQLAKNAYSAICSNWQYKDHAQKWADALNDVVCNFQIRRTKMALSKTSKIDADLGTQE